MTPRQIGGEVGFSDANGVSDADGWQRAGGDEAPHRPGADTEMLGDLPDGEQAG